MNVRAHKTTCKLGLDIQHHPRAGLWTADACPGRQSWPPVPDRNSMRALNPQCFTCIQIHLHEHETKRFSVSTDMLRGRLTHFHLRLQR